jgi:MFS family permease
VKLFELLVLRCSLEEGEDMFHVNGKKSRVVVVVLLFLFMVINFADKAALGLVAVPLMHELGFTSEEFGLIAGSFFFLFAVSGVVFGFISNHVSSKWLLALLAVIWSLAQFPIAFGASSLALLIAARVLLGVGEGPAYPLALHACYKWFPDKKRNIPTAVVMQGGQVGMLVAGPVVALTMAHYGWRDAFLVLGLGGLVWLALWVFYGKEGTMSAPTDASPSDDKAAQVQASISYVALLFERTFLGSMVVYWAAYWVVAIVFTWVPAYLQKSLMYTPVEAGWMFSFFIALSLPVVSLGSYWSDRMLRNGATSRFARGVLVSCLMILGAALILAGVYADVSRYMRVVLLALGCSLPQVSFVLCAAVTAEISPACQRGASLAVTNSVATTAGLIAPMAMGRFVQTFPGASGFNHGFLFSALILACGGVIGLMLINPARTLRRTVGHDAVQGIGMAPTFEANRQ